MGLSGDTIKLSDSTTDALNNKAVTLRGLANENNGTFTFDSTTIEVNNGKKSIGIYNDSSLEDIVINNVDIKVKGADTSYGMYVNTGTFGIQTVGENKESIIDVAADKAYGIYINSASATVNFGINDGDGTINSNVSVIEPLVKAMGTTSGIGVRKVNGKFNYFDGKIIGSTYAKPETTTNVESRFEARFFLVTDSEPGVEVKPGEEDGEYIYEYCILQYLGPQTDNP